MRLSKVTFFAAALLSLNSIAMEKADCDHIGSPNPAATFCTENGGRLEQVTTTAGEDAVCVFECERGRSVCGQWAYLRGECEPGTCAEWSSETNECATWIEDGAEGDDVSTSSEESANNENAEATTIANSDEGNCACGTTQIADVEVTHCGCNHNHGLDHGDREATVVDGCDCGSPVQDNITIQPVIGGGGCEI